MTAAILAFHRRRDSLPATWRSRGPPVRSALIVRASVGTTFRTFQKGLQSCLRILETSCWQMAHNAACPMRVRQFSSSSDQTGRECLRCCPGNGTMLPPSADTRLLLLRPLRCDHRVGCLLPSLVGVVIGSSCRARHPDGADAVKRPGMPVIVQPATKAPPTPQDYFAALLHGSGPSRTLRTERLSGAGT